MSLPCNPSDLALLAADFQRIPRGMVSAVKTSLLCRWARAVHAITDPAPPPPPPSGPTDPPAGMVLWLDPSTISSGPGQDIRTWHDKTTNANDFTDDPNWPGQFPYERLGGALFDSSNNQVLCSSAPGPGLPLSIVAVIKPTLVDLNGAYGVLGTNDYTSGLTVIGQEGQIALRFNDGVQASASDPMDVNGQQILIEAYVAGGTSVPQFFINGTQVATSQYISHDTGLGYNNTAATRMIAGAFCSADWGVTFPFNGVIYELLVYPGILSDADKAIARAYLSAKYSLGVPAGPLVIRASEAGCALNSNIDTGGGTDDTLALQNALDEIDANGGGTLILDGVALISDTIIQAQEAVGTATQTAALMVGSNTTIQCEAGAGVFLKAGSNCTMLSNKGITGDPNATFDHDITITGGVWNGNCDNQAKSERNNASNIWSVGFWFGGFARVTLNSVTLRNAQTFSMLFSNGGTLTVQDCITTYDAAPVLNTNHDGIHFWGTVDGASITNYTAYQCSDDLIAFNTDEGVSTYQDSPAAWGRSRMPISNTMGALRNIEVNGVTATDCSHGIALYNFARGSNQLTNVAIRNVSGQGASFSHIGNGRRSGTLALTNFVVDNCTAADHLGWFWTQVPPNMQTTSISAFDGSSITLNWTNVPNATGYSVGYTARDFITGEMTDGLQPMLSGDTLTVGGDFMISSVQVYAYSGGSLLCILDSTPMPH